MKKKYFTQEEKRQAQREADKRCYLKKSSERKAKAKAYYSAHKDEVIEKNTRRYQITRIELRSEIFRLLGQKCVKCGFDDPRALDIDHVNGMGRRHRKNFTEISFSRYVLKEIGEGSQDFQLLCRNCNWIKYLESK